MTESKKLTKRAPNRLTRKQARDALPDDLRSMFDQLCEETLLWSQYYYGSTLISYSIIKELIEDGWRKGPTTKINS